MVDAIGSSAPAWPPTRTPDRDGQARTGDAADPGSRPAGPRSPSGKPLTPAQQREISRLQDRDRDVRTHEAAHRAAGGSLTGGASYDFQTGPDGRQYAVGGEVSIDIGRERDPHATVSKMQRVIAAALAPADPSGQDQAVAAQAQAIELQAQQEIAKQAVGGSDAGKGSDDGKADDGKADDAAGTAKRTSAVDRAYGQQAPEAGGLLSLVA